MRRFRAVAVSRDASRATEVDDLVRERQDEKRRTEPDDRKTGSEPSV